MRSRAVHDIFKCRQNIFSDRVATVLFVAVRFVGHKGDSALMKITQYLLFGDAEKGTDDAVALPDCLDARK